MRRGTLWLLLSAMAISLAACEHAPSGGSGGADEIVVTASRVRGDRSDRSDRAPMPSPPPPPAMAGEMSAPDLAKPGLVAPMPPRQPVGRAGVLTAGDYDDLLNADLYGVYATKYLQGARDASLPWVDTRRRITVTVTDKDGDRAPFARIVVDRGGDAALALNTAADGTAVLYPDLDRLPEAFEVRVLTAAGQSAATQRVTAADLARSRIVSLKIATDASPVKAMDLLLVIDTTGSMGDEIAYLKAELGAILADVAKRHPGLDIRVGLIVYRDVGDDYVVRSFPFTTDIAGLEKSLQDQGYGGGGDYPEAMDQAMAAASTMGWREGSANILLLVADAPPHAENVAKTWKAALDARDRRVHIVPVAASGVADEAQFLMRSMAAVTQSRYLFLTDDSGVGNAHAEPDVNCYVVTRLDSQIRRAIDSIISGKRVEPDQQDVIRTVGQYDRGVCKGVKAAK